MATSLEQLVAPFGAPGKGVVDLRGEADARQTRYLDLILKAKAPHQAPQFSVPDGVIEVQSQPVAYVVDASAATPSPSAVTDLGKKLALRDEAPYLVIAEPGKLSVFPTSLELADTGSQLLSVRAHDHAAPTTFASLYLTPRNGDHSHRAVFNRLFQLLTDTIAAIENEGIALEDALSLAGRALFMRFLLDRNILTLDHLQEVLPHVSEATSVFADRRAALATCRWLDQTFNGDFLPFSDDVGKFLGRLPERACDHLTDIMHRSPGGQLPLRFGWGDLDFSYIPVGVLSQIYEWAAGKWMVAQRHEHGIYYTPRRIAEFMVNEVFEAIAARGPVSPHLVRVLDPAAGGGVFLVSAFQAIVAAWRVAHGRFPDTAELRTILYQQLVGFEINEPALRLAALSLYLTAIELDSNPRPIEKLHFYPLRDHVLFNMQSSQDEEVPIGSLGDAAQGGHQHAYDIVIGNPPWTAWKDERGRIAHGQVVRSLRPFVHQRLGARRASAFEIPDLVPDLAFAWRALQWARPDGTIALVLHARFLFKTSLAGISARSDLVEAMSVTGIVNGADLRSTEVWPKVTAPFCLLFARNETPQRGRAFHFASPYWDEPVNRQGRLRVDYLAAQPVDVSKLSAEPNLLKALFRGTPLDWGVLKRIDERGFVRIAKLCSMENLAAGRGYQVAPRSRQKESSRNSDRVGDRPSRRRQSVLDQREAQAEFIRGLPSLTANAEPAFLVQPGPPLGEHCVLHRYRQARIFLGPILLIREAPPGEPRRPMAQVSFENLSYSESFVGLSTHGHRNSDLLVRYLGLLANCSLFRWHMLITSSKFGVERDTIQKLDVENFPLPHPDGLTPLERVEIQQLSDELLGSGYEMKVALEQQLENWCLKLYGLDSIDAEVIRDTLAVSLPFTSTRRRANARPSSDEVSLFMEALAQALRPMSGERALVRRLQLPPMSPWELLSVDLSGGTDVSIDHSFIVRQLIDVADELGASQIVLPDSGLGRFWIGLLRQYRFWTPTRARLCALEIVDLLRERGRSYPPQEVLPIVHA